MVDPLFPCGLAFSSRLVPASLQSVLEQHSKRARAEAIDLVGLGSDTCPMSFDHSLFVKASHKTSLDSKGSERATSLGSDHKVFCGYLCKLSNILTAQ